MTRKSKPRETSIPPEDISQEMLEMSTCDEASRGEGAFDPDLLESWLIFSRSVRQTGQTAFDTPLDVEQTLCRALASEKPLILPRRRVVLFARWAGASAVALLILFFATGIVRFLPDLAPEDASISTFATDIDPSELEWDTSIGEEIQMMDSLLSEMEQGWATIDMELALVRSSLDLMGSDMVDGDEDWF